MSLEAFHVKLIEVVAAEFLIHATLALKVISDDQHCYKMGYACPSKSLPPHVRCGAAS
jgi:hypothetical protein